MSNLSSSHPLLRLTTTDSEEQIGSTLNESVLKFASGSLADQARFRSDDVLFPPWATAGFIIRFILDNEEYALTDRIFLSANKIIHANASTYIGPDDILGKLARTYKPLEEPMRTGRYDARKDLDDIKFKLNSGPKPNFKQIDLENIASAQQTQHIKEGLIVTIDGSALDKKYTNPDLVKLTSATLGEEFYKRGALQAMKRRDIKLQILLPNSNSTLGKIVGQVGTVTLKDNYTIQFNMAGPVDLSKKIYNGILVVEPSSVLEKYG